MYFQIAKRLYFLLTRKGVYQILIFSGLITYHSEHTTPVQLDFPYSASLHWPVLDCCTLVTDKMFLL